MTTWTPATDALSEECESCRGTARGCDSKRLWQGAFCCARCSHDEIVVHAPTRAAAAPPAPLSGAAARAALMNRMPQQ